MRIRCISILFFTAKILALATGVLSVEMPLKAQTVVWSGLDATKNVNTNWSDANNWIGGTPGPATNICFFNPGANAAQGVVDNGQLTITVTPIRAALLNPVVVGPNMTYSVIGNQLDLSWPANYVGWLLQSNAAGLAASNDWFTVPGSTTTNDMQITIRPVPGSVLYRMVEP
jgi:hypothetical protein